MSENKPREFQILLDQNNGDEFVKAGPSDKVYCYDTGGWVHVIEYSAYQKAIDALRNECHCTGETDYSYPPKTILCDVCDVLQELGENRGDG